VITSSKLKTFIESPRSYYEIYVKEIPIDACRAPAGIEKGTMIDLYMLQPEKFAELYSFPVGSGLKADLVEACKQN